MCKAWEGFTTGAWQSRIDVRDFIQKNYTPYGGDEAFLAPATPRTQALMHKLQGLMKLEQEFGGVLDVDTQTVSSLLNYKPGYLSFPGRWSRSSPTAPPTTTAYSACTTSRPVRPGTAA